MNRQLEKLMKRITVFSVLMLLLGLLLGIYSREMLRHLSGNMEMVRYLTVQNQVFLLHGHAILYGTLLPMALAFGAYLIRDKIGEKEAKNLSRAFLAWIIGVILTLGTSIYQETFLMLSLFADPAKDLAAIDSAMFCGNPLFRMGTFGIAHFVLAIGMAWFGIAVWRGWKKD